MKLVSNQPAIQSQNTGPMTAEVLAECREKLLEKKMQILNQSRSMMQEYQSRDKSGDEVDQSVEVLAEQQFFSTQERLRFQLMEIEYALARIENGTFGICEETEEFIELERLRAIPWTRLSIEGAEMREALEKRFAR